MKLVTATGANAPAYTDDATAEVYTYASGKWSLNADLTTTTNDGTASIGVTNGASYRIRVLPDSTLLAPVWVGALPLANSVNDASTIVIPAVGKAPTMDNVVINVSAGVVKGHVTDSFNGDVSGALVELVNSSGDVLKGATSREDGIYNIYRVNPGKYSVRFTSEQYAIKYANNIVVVGGSSTQVDMSLNSASGITGQLISTDDQPVVGASVYIFSAAGSGVTPIQSVTTNDDGTYNFIGLVTGSYKIRFDASTADVPTSAFWYSDGANVGTFKDASAVAAELGEYTKNVNPVPTKSWALIKGTILDSANAVSGAAVSLVTVSLATLTGKVVTTDLTDENGNFALYAPDGSYQIQVAASGFAAGFIDATEGGDAVLSTSAVGAAVVSVSDNVAQIDGGLNTDDLTLDLAGSGGSITVTVKDDAGKTVTDGDVTVYDSTGNVAGFASGAQGGVFAIAGLSGTYRVSYAQDGVFAKTFYGDTSNIADPKTKTATVNKITKPSITINVKTLPKLTVNVVDGATPATAFKQPITVEVYSQVDGEWTLNDALTQETSSGSVSFGVANGDQYRIRVVPNSELLTPVWVGAARLAKSVSAASTISIPATGAAPALGNVVMNSLAGVIDGTVSDSELTGIPGAEVTLIDNMGEVASATTTRSDGGFHFGQILSGTYTVKFVADGYAIKYAKKYVVVAGQSATLDTQLTPATGISGRALLDGQPTAQIVGATVSVYSANGSGSTAIQTVQTDADGNYNFIGLLAGSYKVYFDNSNAEVPAESFWYGADANVATFKEAAAITATLGSYASGIDPQPVAPWTLFTGNIHDGQWAVVGGSVSLVSVSLISLSGNSALTGITDDLGDFAIYAPDGAYRIKVAAPGYLTGYVDASEVGTPILSTSAATAAVLFVSEGTLAFDSGLTNTALSLDLGASGGKISVTVKDELGQVATDGVVSAYDKTGKIVATDDSSVGGVFTLAGLRGYYRVSYQQDGVFAETFFGDTLSLGSAGTKTLTVTDGANIAAAIKVKTLPKLTVNIYSAGTTAYKQPVTVEVYTLSDGQWLLDSGLTKETSEGVLTFGVENLNQYRIRLVPVNPALAPVWLGANTSALTVATAKSILIPAAGAVPAVSGLVNVNAATISGAVTDSFQTVMSGVTVQLIAANGDVVSETATIEDGTYSFIQVVPGTYNFRFAAERFSDKVVRTVVIAAGATATQDAVLDSASGISGRVLG
ncbi:MAG: carboxypeptidase regulatory-like domain-containing protein, partial [Actinobacteria bacterium]|nr:carboxypeptidase regulatory-like domain-containing protein [Actinomycetota bacterium]